MSQIKLKIKDDFLIVLLLSCFVGHLAVHAELGARLNAKMQIICEYFSFPVKSTVLHIKLIHILQFLHFQMCTRTVIKCCDALMCGLWMSHFLAPICSFEVSCFFFLMSLKFLDF